MRLRYGMLALLGLTVLVVGNWWLNRLLQPAPPPAPAVDRRVDYALTDFRAAFFDADGAETLRVSGPALSHDAVTRVAEIESPTFALQPAKQGWTGEAERAVIEREADTLTLVGNVRLKRPDPRGLVTIRSERLVHERPANTLRSPGPVRVTQAGDLLTGGSLVVWVDDERMELSDDVHAVYRGAGAAAGD
jgi:LPS export ABC transporter protein LptC